MSDAGRERAVHGPSYCAEQVRRHDHDRYLTCLFAPAARREALFALYALNLELARTAEVVTEPLLGQIRLQWWREALDSLFSGAPPRHEALEPLVQAAAGGRLSPAHFTRLIDAREADLDPAPPANLGALEDYAEATSATLLWLALEILDASTETAMRATRHVGIAWALTGLLRAVPFHARQKRLYLPRDLTEAAGLSPRDLFELRPTPSLQRVAERIAGRAVQHLHEARVLRARLPRAALPALLPATLADHALSVLRGAGYDPFHPAVQARSPGRAWRLAWARLRMRY